MKKLLSFALAAMLLVSLVSFASAEDKAVNVGISNALTTLNPLAMEICGEMENPAIVQPLALLLPNAVRAWRDQARAGGGAGAGDVAGVLRNLRRI